MSKKYTVTLQCRFWRHTRAMIMATLRHNKINAIHRYYGREVCFDFENEDEATIFALTYTWGDIEKMIDDFAKERQRKREQGLL